MTKQVRDAYDRWAATYDSMGNPTRDLDAELLRADLSTWILGDVLEVGCGTGKNTSWLVQRARRVVGLDISPEMLARCQERVPGAEVRIADLTAKWPVDGEGADVLLADLVLEHVEDLGHIASESARVLKPGGRARISELHPWRQHEGKAACFDDGGEVVRPPAFVHTTEEYVSAFLGVGFALDALSEPRSPGDPKERPPRLLVLEFTLAPGR